MPWHDVASHADLPVGQAKPFRVHGQPILLVRDGDEVRACDAVCPHKSSALEGGPVEHGHIHCAVHEADFELTTGRPAPGCEWAGSLPVYPAKVEEGRVWVDLPPAEIL